MSRSTALLGSLLAAALLVGGILVVAGFERVDPGLWDAVRGGDGTSTGPSADGPTVTPSERPTETDGADGANDRSRRPLAGRTVVLDPGHRLGNRNFPEEVNRPVESGGFTKPCNTTGTATADGYPEATFVWQVAELVRVRLARLGATVVLTRPDNRDDRWGPCVDRRGRAGNGSADLKLSIHADGSLSGGHGFHVISPDPVPGLTGDVVTSSARLARAVRSGLREADLPVADYVAGGDGLDRRSDLGTLNLAEIPVVMAELGNMREESDATRMTTVRGRETYANGLVNGIRRYFRAEVGSP